MSNRPSLARKHTRSSEQSRNDALNAGLRITIDGEHYEARLRDVPPSLARELRRESGMGFIELMKEISREPDADLLSAFVWVARRLRGEFVAFDEVEVTYEQILSDSFDVDTATGEEVGEHPES